MAGLRLSEIAERVGGILHEDRKIMIHGVAGLREAVEGQISFLANTRYLPELKKTKASAVLVSKGFKSPPSPTICIEVPNPYYAFTQVLHIFHDKPYEATGVSSQAKLEEGVEIGEDPSIGPFVFIEKGVRLGSRVVIHAGSYIGKGSEIGDDCLIYPNVTIREGVKIGKRVIIHSGTVVGSDGFGYAEHQGEHHKIPQVGRVVLEDDVELGANVAIDRAALGETLIGEGTKVDNLVQVAHNVKTGKSCLLIAQVGISGSTVLGHHVTLAGQVGVVGHIRIGDQVIVGAQSGVISDIPAKKIMTGFPVMDHREWLKSRAVFPSLPDIKKRLARLEKRIVMLEGNQNKKNQG